MKKILLRSVGVASFLLLPAVVSLHAQQTPPTPAVTVPASGTFHGDGRFAGTVTINRFEQRNGTDIVAVGFVSGTLSRGGKSIGTAVAGQVTWPVTVKSGGQTLLVRGTPKAPTPLERAALMTPRDLGRYVFAQTTTCSVLDTTLGPEDINLLGFTVHLDAITIDIAGTQGTPLGDLVCAASNLIGNVAGVVNLLNNVLSLVTGLLGGITGGLGGLGGGLTGA